MVENAMTLDRKKSEVKRPIETLDAEVPSPKGTWKKDVSFAPLPFAIEVGFLGGISRFMLPHAIAEN